MEIHGNPCVLETLETCDLDPAVDLSGHCHPVHPIFEKKSRSKSHLFGTILANNR